MQTALTLEALTEAGLPAGEATSFLASYHAATRGVALADA